MTGGEKMAGKELPIVGCPGAVKIPTDKEKEALDKLRGIKAKVRELKDRLAGLESEGAGDDEILAINRLLEELRLQWDQWQAKREEAARERMILLGHE